MRNLKTVGILTTSILLGVAGQCVAAEVDLKTAYFIGNHKSPTRQAFNKFVDRVNAKGKGELKISRVMGTDAIPAFQMATALKNGILDLTVLPPSYAGNLVPGIEAMSSSNTSPVEQRKNGAFDLIQGLFKEKLNAMYLGQFGYGANFHLFVNKKISSVADIRGMRLRTSGTYKAALDAFGAKSIQTKRGEIYTALERGVIEGYPQLPANLKPAGWHEVTKFMVVPGFYHVSQIILVNLNKWNGLSDRQKSILDEAGRYTDSEITEWYASVAQKKAKELDSLGVKTINLPEKEAKEFVRKAFEAKWSASMKKAPEYIGKLKKLIYR